MQTIGERLEEARKRKSISIREAAEGTKIRGDYLQKFESNQFNIGLTDIYIRGFLRSYASFLGLPAERIVNDYASLGHAEARPRTPSREVYGRMELSVSSGGGDRGSAEGPATESAGAAAAGEGAVHQRPSLSLRPHASGLPPTNRINPALAFKGLFIFAGVAAVLILFFLVKALFGGSHRATETSTASAPAPVATPAEVTALPDAASTLTLIALQPVSVRVFRQSDSLELFNGQMASGERKDFPNVGLKVTASALELLQLEFKGARYQIAAKGRGAVVVNVMK